LARFQCVFPDFCIDPIVFTYAQKMKKELKYLSKERIFKELYKVFQTHQPYLFFKTLKDLDVFDNIFGAYGFSIEGRLACDVFNTVIQYSSKFDHPKFWYDGVMLYHFNVHPTLYPLWLKDSGNLKKIKPLSRLIDFLTTPDHLTQSVVFARQMIAILNRLSPHDRHLMMEIMGLIHGRLSFQTERFLTLCEYFKTAHWLKEKPHHVSYEDWFLTTLTPFWEKLSV